MQQIAIQRVELLLAHRAHPRKALPAVCRAASAHLARQNHVGIGRNHRLLRHRRRCHRQVGKDIHPTAQPQHIADHMLTIQRIQGLIPHLIKHPQRPRLGIVLAQARQPLAKLPGRRLRLRLAAHQRAQLQQSLRNSLQLGRLAVKQRHTQPAQRLQLALGVAMQPHHQQIRLQGQHPLDIHLAIVPHARHLLGRLGVITVADHSHQPRTATGCVNQLGDMRRQADYPACRRVERHHLPGIVAHLHLSPGGGRQRRQHQAHPQLLTILQHHVHPCS